MNWMILTTVLVCLEIITPAVVEKMLKREIKIDRRSPWEYAMLKHLLGNPKENPNTAKAVKGERRTTRLHKLCSGKIKLHDEWSKDKLIYDKIICGMFTKQDIYKKHEEHVARLLSRKTEENLDEQKAELIRAVNQMVRAAGPLPTLNLQG
ncbi:uncharacterized protein [Montipora capricornis]|uniref:uncharacterized protein isoform X1 n=1 Tax=Montipora capricornis TaxID=246305 RepID=UPI0035F1F7F8